jgi:arylsulfatase
MYDDEGAAEALSFLRAADFGDREFLFINLMEAHWPYWGDADFLSFTENPIDE